MLRGCADELDKEVLEKCLNDKCETCSSLEGAPVCNGNVRRKMKKPKRKQRKK